MKTVINVQFKATLRALLTAGDLAQRVEALNEIRAVIHDASPFKDEPVDFVEWVASGDVTGNDYNPNSVAPPEMELLRLSIDADGFTQPVVTSAEGGTRVVVDGFHRHRVGNECDDIRARVHGYLPVVQIRSERTDKGDRIASTIRHNRARGKHQVIAMSDIVLDLKRRNWSDDKIGRELGMDPDEVLRLAQITGLAEAFKDRAFSQSWEAVIDDDLDDETIDQISSGGGRCVGSPIRTGRGRTTKPESSTRHPTRTGISNSPMTFSPTRPHWRQRCAPQWTLTHGARSTT